MVHEMLAGLVNMLHNWFHKDPLYQYFQRAPKANQAREEVYKSSLVAKSLSPPSVREGRYPAFPQLHMSNP